MSKLFESKNHSKHLRITNESDLNFNVYYYFWEHKEHCLRRILSFLHKFDATHKKIEIKKTYANLQSMTVESQLNCRSSGTNT